MGTTRLYERWDELQALFEQAVALPAEDAEAFVASGRFSRVWITLRFRR